MRLVERVIILESLTWLFSCLTESQLSQLLGKFTIDSMYGVISYNFNGIFQG